MSWSDHYRQQADLCRMLAQAGKDPEFHKDAAAVYDRLAREHDQFLDEHGELVDKDAA